LKKVKLTQGYAATVSDADYKRVAQFNWHIVRNKTTVYAYSRLGRGKSTPSVPMHTFITGAKVDHIDHNGLHNWRSNLRPCTQRQNMMNRCKTHSKTSSVYKGVCWHKQAGKWTASIRMHRKSIHIGLFASQVVAAKAYDAKARELFGSFACTNFKEKI
jgi:AP2 domain